MGYSRYKQFRLVNNYRKTDNKDKRCQTCKHFYRIEYHSKYYFKCKLQGITSSEVSDIRANHVCDMWNKDIGRLFNI